LYPYSNKDPNWNILITELKDEFAPKNIPNYFRVAPNTNILEKTVLEASSVSTVDSDLTDFVKSLQSTLSEHDYTDDIDKYREDIPSDFHTQFDEYPAAVLRLMHSWSYINQAPFDENENTKNFIKGDKPNWAVIGKGNYFIRDIEESVYDECLDYLTSSKRRPAAISLLEPAGYALAGSFNFRAS